MYCDEANMESPNQCPEGHYCPATTSSVVSGKIECPAGTYNDRPNIGSEDECTPCPVGKSCVAGLTAASTVDCLETFFCPYGALVGDGYTNTYVFGQSASGKCPAGYTCAAGTTAPTPCALGTFQVLAGSTACDACTGGYYCDELGMYELNTPQKCDRGYYCTTGSDIPNPVGDPTGKGDLCEKGYYCPLGSSA